ncbi:MAG: hypothetical protein JNG84_07175 [Archangium sp.]|nr:hypothetical protein [Archangium sp.]
MIDAQRTRMWKPWPVVQRPPPGTAALVAPPSPLHQAVIQFVESPRS